MVSPAVERFRREIADGQTQRGRETNEGRAFVRALRLVTGGMGRLVNVYEASRALLIEDSDDNWLALEEAVAEVGEVQDHPEKMNGGGS